MNQSINDTSNEAANADGLVVWFPVFNLSIHNGGLACA